MYSVYKHDEKDIFVSRVHFTLFPVCLGSLRDDDSVGFHCHTLLAKYLSMSLFVVEVFSFVSASNTA